MSSQVPLGCDRARMNWTPLMERYFIELMLDQMHKGNRMGHTFNKQAWTDMLTMFNAKFGTKYDRDTLKSHYTNLWKQYNDVKSLLEQNGFSWDDTRKMVVANDGVWDAFIKAHPDAQFYKRKSLMNFNDLCLIYAYTAADGRYSRSSHDVDVDDDIQGLVIGSILPATSERVKSEWTSAMDRHFIELMLDQLKKGNKRDRTFSKQAWKDILTLFNAKFCSQHGKIFLKRRYKKLFKYYSDIRSLLEKKGFSWDERQQMIVADDAVWEKTTKARPDTRSYQKRTLSNYHELSLIYGNQVINGHLDHMHLDKNFEDGTVQVKAGEEKDVYLLTRSNGLGPCWSPAMDRYLIDLLQDQALRGNKIGHELTTEAWIEMIGSFNERFGSHLEKNILKNRYEHLRKQYSGINFLLEQNGFSWDEHREMVIAEDYVWDSFIKVHPDARSYRNKSVPSYHKLCVIFGEESSNGRHSHRAHNVDFDSKGPTFVIGDDAQCYANSDCSRADWTPKMDRYFIDLMLDQVIRGHKLDHISDDQAWIDMALLFREKFELKLDKDVLRGCYRSLGRMFNDMKYLLSQRGFAWDETQQLITACDDVWHVYIKENPNARSYKTECKPNYNDLYLIYGNSNSDGGVHQSGPGAKVNNNCCSRTDWTPPMDRFFIDLMLEHVRQGSMVNLRFNKQAWNNMVAKFSAEFGSQYDKDVLRSHFMILGKRFSSMKNLLDQKGFEWDEVRQMIIADDDTWNSYAKENPDARSYCNSALPNYNDLFLIFGDTNNNGRLNYSCHLMDTDDYVLGLNVAEDDDPSPVDYDPQQINWTKSMEIYFIELVLEQVLKGNKVGQTLNEQAWSWIIASFNEQLGLVCDKDAVESWYLSLMEEYNNITDLLNQNGFYWDETEQTIIADDIDWQFYIKEHPGAIKYRDRILSSYNDLCMIYGNGVLVGRLSNYGAKMEIDNNDLDMGLDDIYGDALYPTGEFEVSDYRKKWKPTTSSTSVASRKVQRQNLTYPEALGRKAHIVKTMEGKKEKEYISIEVIVDALQAIPDMDDELFLEACQLLENEKKAKVFVGMDVNQRRKWLFKKLCR
ncbi:hypothetical protein JCGZ_23370 [Jatropha curcas]|uniref:Myb/SANT-like domain-containing protein n=1 Tax=Jatropha curcas TaxID=180498 RepID=A0A067JI30_JATCU|nr:uncharacterized protein LOC105647570 isoform X2 [Jatropha curcas]KDP23537.1 hypothetical protein JCGZ_23370 [Jatropha curcas]